MRGQARRWSGQGAGSSSPGVRREGRSALWQAGGRVPRALLTGALTVVVRGVAVAESAHRRARAARARTRAWRAWARCAARTARCCWWTRCAAWAACRCLPTSGASTPSTRARKRRSAGRQVRALRATGAAAAVAWGLRCRAGRAGDGLAGQGSESGCWVGPVRRVCRRGACVPERARHGEAAQAQDGARHLQPGPQPGEPLIRVIVLAERGMEGPTLGRGLCWAPTHPWRVARCLLNVVALRVVK